MNRLSFCRPPCKRAHRAALALALSCAICGCGDKPLEVQGRLDRLVGEQTTVELRSGSPSFAERVRLLDATGRSFETAQLRVDRSSDRLFSFVVPNGAAIGEAALLIDQAGNAKPEPDAGTGTDANAGIDAGGGEPSREPPNYRFSFHVSRLALTLDGEGNIEAFPLPRSRVLTERAKVDAGGSGRLSLSPTSGMLVALGGNQVRAFRLTGAGIENLDAQQVNGAIAIAATHDGALVATSDTVALLRFDPGPPTELASFAISSVKDIAVDAEATRAVVLHDCDITGDNTPDTDCLTLLELDGANSRKGRLIQGGCEPSPCDPSPTQTLVAVSADGKRAVTVGTRLFGALLDSEPFTFNEVAWPPNSTETGDPVAIDVGPSSLGDLFAIADAATKKVHTFAFARVDEVPTTLAAVSTASLIGTPTGLSFGRLNDLYVTIGRDLFLINAGQQAPEAEPLPLAAEREVISLAVQR